MMQGTNVTIYEVQSDTRARSYEVRFYEDGTVRCECPASTYGRGVDCKHIGRLKAQGAGHKGSTVKVFELEHEGTVVTVVDPSEQDTHQLLDNLRVGKKLVVKRLV